MATIGLKALLNEAGLSLEEILNVSKEEFQGWAKVACKSNVLRRASIYNEWKTFRNETSGDIRNLQSLCEQAGATMREVVTMSSEDFRELTKVMNVGGITQHTLLFQEKKRLHEAMRGSESNGMIALAAVGPMLDIATAPKKLDLDSIIAAASKGEQVVSPEHHHPDARNDESSSEVRGMARSISDDSRQNGSLNPEDTSGLANRVIPTQDENSLLNDVLMSSHNIDPSGNGQLSLEFVWQLANTQKRAANFLSENQVIFPGGSNIGSRRYIKFVQSFRSLYMVSSDEDREVLAGLLVLVGQTRGYRFLRRDVATGELMGMSDELAKQHTMDILLPPKQTRAKKDKYAALSRDTKYPRGQTKFTEEEDNLIRTYVMTSQEQPFTSWARLADRMPQYKSKQIRDRWINHLNPSIDHSPFSDEDVSLIVI